MNRVSIVKCDSYDPVEVYESLKKSLNMLGGISAFVKKGEKVLLKPNLLIGKPAHRCVNTHPAVLQAACRLVIEAGGSPFIGDSPGFQSALFNAKRAGYYEFAKENNIPFVEFNDPYLFSFEDGFVFKKFELEKSIKDYDRIINLPKLKTHGMMMLTTAVKNLYGVIPGYKKLHWHLTARDDYVKFGTFLIDLYRFIKPDLNILDAVDGMEGNGPQSGQKRHIGLLLAGADGISLDRIVCELTGFRPNLVPAMTAAIELGVPEAHTGNIEILGESIKNVRIKNFKPPRRKALSFYRVPSFLKKLLNKFFVILPRIDHKSCTKCKICINSCPNDAISLLNKNPGKDKPHKALVNIRIDYDSCIRCYCCQEMCPEGAIRLK